MFNNSVLIVPHGDRIIMQTAGTCSLTQCRADAGCKFREVVGFVQTLVSLLPCSHIDQIIPLRHQIVQRATAGHAHECHT